MHTTSSVKAVKGSSEKLAMMTAYDAPTASLLEQAGMDMILIGDSAGMVVHGYDSTIPVTVDDLVLHTKAVRRGAPNTFTVTDFPFLTAHQSRDVVMAAAGRFMQEGGAHAVKLEGSEPAVITAVSQLVQAGVPVMAHLGLTPQHVNVTGGYKVQAKEEAEAKKLLADAKALEQTGCFALVLECVPKDIAAVVTNEIDIPVIGIGAGPDVDGQVLVFHDAVGLTSGFTPKFVKKYAELGTLASEAVSTYVQEVKSSQFPEDVHSFKETGQLVGKAYGGAKR
ncbi:3-methyl-2-oxobutanoate hydroxymethyltransferase [Salsuginibacillus kocurii]|uniref:3-methyl-2-oxobutanoate hydroxymethyltransferase n=1 Tax=Salsuginibacillus kocurii TaxID=427078 RepID=UPI00037B129F|nr:3-methyl-2-oxobutanoate hydroxymethyltransferase [Salsuginibacillus kocurii]